jgi:fructokinase
VTSSVYGAVEAGGTKFICAIGQGPDVLLSRCRLPTTTPADTLAAVREFFRRGEREFGKLRAIGVAGFGPLDIDRASATFGCLLDTPKAGWSGASLLQPLREQFAIPLALDTDVNAAALAEARLGAGRGMRSIAYITVGTGIGGGFCIDGQTLKGAMHPEVGHLQVRRDPLDHAFEGCCPFHGDCLEGLASGPAIAARWGVALNEVDANIGAVRLIGGYLGQLAASVALTVSSQMIVFGGGVMAAPGLLEEIRGSMTGQLKGYLPRPPVLVTPGLGNDSGIMGAMLCAMAAT